ncbi:MAG: alpha/beta fold hydrolase [Deltaproteobacteria bacterium]|nr:alpha/beta fold hydrolase [Deltaproteobacteria bacterium]MBW2413309.1 alpha/beta fold hydrolase [Deltaproteobacteria bacterium]
MKRLRHGKVELALHTLRPGEERPLLLLHGLGERSPAAVPDELSAWTGPVYALDFTGHGASTIPKGGGYHPEMLLADADAALAELGPVTLAGRGLGGYVAILLAGARPDRVRGVLVLDGPGLSGGGARPVSTHIGTPDRDASAPPDPFALLELSTDVRPPDYATLFARRARDLSGIDRPIAVCAAERPVWLEAVLGDSGVEASEPGEALARFASL